MVEGVAFGLKDSFNLIQGAGLGRIDQVRMSGGGAKSSLWRQIMADVLRAELVTANTAEGAAYGAAILAGVGGGAWPDVEAACAGTIKIAGRIEPDPSCEGIYREMYEQYRALYPALKPTFDCLAAMEA